MTDTLGMRIRLARVRQGIRQTELARRIGISGTAMNQIELGGIDPRASRIKAIAEELGVSADYLLGSLSTRGRHGSVPTPGAARAGSPAHQAARRNGTHPAPAPAPAGQRHRRSPPGPRRCVRIAIRRWCPWTTDRG